MNCSVTELRNKEVINTKNACRLGCVSDVEICCDNGNITAIIIWGKGRMLGFSGRDEDIRIPWCDVQAIGEDTVLVCTDKCSCEPVRRDRKKIFDFIFK